MPAAYQFSGGEEPFYGEKDVKSAQTGSRAPISIESQLLSVGAGFVVFVALVALLATVHRRKRRGSATSQFRSPLIQHSSASLKSNRSLPGKVGVTHFRPQQRQVSPPGSQLQSPGSDSSGSSPQCTPMTPYSSFGLHHHNQYAYHQQETMKIENLQPILSDTNRGSIALQLQYDATNSALQVTILACHDLPECTLNPYVKLRLLPDNQHRVKTRVLRGTRNPFYDETFTMYGITPANICNYSLYLAVLASDRYSRDLILGEAVYNLAGEQSDFINNNQKLSTTLKLKARQAPENDGKRGQMLISMAHNVHSNSINVAVLKMKDLPRDNAIGLIDPYVKVYMLVNGQRVAKQKTHVKKKTRDPVFNESFSFDLTQKLSKDGKRLSPASTPTPLDSVAFQLLVLNHDGVTRNEVVGQCVVDFQSQHFQQIRSAPGQQIAEWHVVQP
ncbi:c2 domain-containing protein [Ditylenchus destructor]|nr:c2 domain-containing protein [Ditylenchus destructor]